MKIYRIMLKIKTKACAFSENRTKYSGILLYPDYDMELSQNLISCSFGQVLFT